MDWTRVAKAEMHLHFEAALSWPRFAELAGRTEPAAPWLSDADPFPSFEHFLGPWRRDLLPALRLPGRYLAWIDGVARWLAAAGVTYAELGVATELMSKLGVPLEDTIPALCQAKVDAERAHGVTLRLFGALKRDVPAADNARLVERWVELAGPHVTGIDLHGYELEGPTAAQKPAFDLARQAGLALRAHAGEHGTARDVAEAIDVLGVTSVHHGIKAASDPGLCRELATRGIPLHTCPTSNVMLGVVPSYRDFPLRTLLDAGVDVTLNSDDPLLFATDLNRELAELERALGLTPAEVEHCLATAWRHARR
jgi:adenosine deaminase